MPAACRSSTATGIDDSALKLMAERGVYFDPHVGVVMQNYLRNGPDFWASRITRKKASLRWNRR